MMKNILPSLALLGVLFGACAQPAQAAAVPCTVPPALPQGVAAPAPSAFHPFPQAGDDYWRDSIPEAMRRDYIALGEPYRGQPWTAIPQELFAEFRTNGNRTRYEDACFGVRRRLSCLVMAEVMQGEGRFTGDIAQGLRYFLTQEPWWGLPAHYPKACPDSTLQVVDLFNAETAATLAWTVYMLGAQLPGPLTDSVRTAIGTRFLLPTLYNEQGWKRNANNWNTWITSNWLACTLLCERDEARRREALHGIRDCLTLFLDGYPDDGGCEEGVGYWDRAAASLFESLWLMQQLPAGERLALTRQQAEKVRAMGRFITTMHIHDLLFVNFSDATSRNLPNINILFPYGCWLDDAPMMQLAAHIGRQHDYLRHPSRLFLPSGNWPPLGRELLMLSLLPRFRQTGPQQPRTEEAYLANSQIMVASNDTWFLAAKGGHNGESHNHNDVGNVIVCHRDQPVVIDLGRDTYTALTFSARRYELLNNRSAYHNVPLVGGCEQAEGRAHAARHATATLGLRPTLRMDIAPAYPAGAAVDSLIERVTLDRLSNTVELAYQFALRQTAGTTCLTLLCLGRPSLRGKGTLALKDGSVLLGYDARLLTPTWERVGLGEGILHDQWGDDVYRLRLTLKRKALRRGRVVLRFSSATATPAPATTGSARAASAPLRASGLER